MGFLILVVILILAAGVAACIVAFRSAKSPESRGGAAVGVVALIGAIIMLAGTFKEDTVGNSIPGSPPAMVVLLEFFSDLLASGLWAFAAFFGAFLIVGILAKVVLRTVAWTLHKPIPPWRASDLSARVEWCCIGLAVIIALPIWYSKYDQYCQFIELFVVNDRVVINYPFPKPNQSIPFVDIQSFRVVKTHTGTSLRHKSSVLAHIEIATSTDTHTSMLWSADDDVSVAINAARSSSGTLVPISK